MEIVEKKKKKDADEAVTKKRGRQAKVVKTSRADPEAEEKEVKEEAAAEETEVGCSCVRSHLSSRGQYLRSAKQVARQWIDQLATFMFHVDEC